ncbi:thioesterase II family protein [Ruminococcus sp. XPD3002]|uniref:thioesterase II family protein n=1 Tax=Ruminococcus sp. XPD3002 TaxID=1452269 RepID=UPI000918593F|nr:Surfactin synthase thioesterase subunit [Ruminococcus flavefaciens]
MLKKERRVKQFPYGLTDKEKPYRLFCFHHAGGNVVVFRNWLGFSSHVEVIPVEIPGHSSRMNEECVTDFNEVVEESAEAIARASDNRPIYLYGHSLGAVIAFQTAYILKSRYGIEVRKLFVAGRQAPMDEDVTGFKLEMGIKKMYEELINMGMTTEKDVEDETFRKVFQPILVSDYRLNENYRYNGEKLNIPIVAFSGDEDHTAPSGVMKRWKKVTEKSFKHYEFHGSHFFPYDNGEKNVLSILRSEIFVSEGRNVPVKA